MKLVTVSEEMGVHERYISPKEIVGDAVTVQLKQGGAFYFKVYGHREKTDAIKEFISGHDDERLNLTIAVDDIDFVLKRVQS